VTTFLAPYKGLYLPNAWSQTLQTSKRHTFKVSAFHRYHWFGIKLFPVGCVQDSRRYHKNAKKCCFWISLRPRYKMREFFMIAPVLTSTLTVCRRNRGDRRLYIGLRVALQVLHTQKHSRSGLAWSRPRTDRGLSWPTSVFRTTIGVCKILSRSVEIWQYEDQKPVLSKNRERPSLCLVVNKTIKKKY